MGRAHSMNKAEKEYISDIGRKGRKKETTRMTKM
jgi:hypothetical protein